MKKRIFKYMTLIILITALLLAILSSLILEKKFSEQIKNGMKTLRITIVDKDGNVDFDSMHTELSNRSERPEIIQALETGIGESERYSETLEKTTYYYAMKINDNKVLRLAVTMDNIYLWLYNIIPFVIFVLIIAILVSIFCAKRLTNKIIAPINDMDIDNITNLPYDELLPFVKKINYQKTEIQQQLLNLESKSTTMNVIMDNMKEGLIFVDAKGIVLLSNRCAEGIFRSKRSSADGNLIGKNILHINRNIKFIELSKQTLAGLDSKMIFHYNSCVYSIYFSPVSLNESANGAIILFLDVTDKMTGEKQRKEFSANISHELKTPLTTILALSEMIGNGMAKDQDVQSFAQKINAQSSRLLSLITDIIRLSEFDEHIKYNTENELETFDILELSKNVADSLSTSAVNKNVTINIIDNQDDILVVADKRMVDELLFNLIDNGIKYNKSGGKVDVSICKYEDFVKIEVSDNGIGIKKEHHARIFERFYRVDKSRSRLTGGTGLGLSIVKHISEFHGGSVSIHSEEYIGTTISCLIKQNVGNTH